MPSRSPKACPSCGAVVPAGIRCPDCDRTRRARDVDERKADLRAYWTRAHRRRFRQAVLDRDPLCVSCGRVATVADHWPRTRKQLIEAGEDPNDPAFGRGLCVSCHNKWTARSMPGGWNRRS